MKVNKQTRRSPRPVVVYRASLYAVLVVFWKGDFNWALYRYIQIAAIYSSRKRHSAS